VTDVNAIGLFPSEYPGLVMSNDGDPYAYADRLEEYLIKLGGITGETACNHQYGNGVITLYLLRSGIEPSRIRPTISRVPGSSNHNTEFDDFLMLADGQSGKGHVIQIKMAFQEPMRARTTWRCFRVLDLHCRHCDKKRAAACRRIALQVKMCKYNLLDGVSMAVRSRCATARSKEMRVVN
jgi:hypothetical protein